MSRLSNVSVQPHCRWCGKPIPKHGTIVYVKEERNKHDTALGRCIYIGKGKRLRSKAECVPFTNQTILSVRYSEEREGYDGLVTGRYVYSFTEWDGETYADRFFCNGDHAKEMGYAAAEKGWSTKSYREKEKVS